LAIGRDATGSRPDRRVSKTRKALKEALTDLILEEGYEAVTVQDIIDRADVGRSTFYSHFTDKDDLLMAILADLEVPGPDTSSWRADDPAFGWTLELFRHFGSGKRLFKAVASSQSGALARRETTSRLEGLARAELSRLKAARKLDAFKLETVVRFLVGTFIGFMDWWMREENEHLPAEEVDHAFRSLVLPGVASVLELDLELPTSL
jgi:AcrR family transcriptional regulator